MTKMLPDCPTSRRRHARPAIIRQVLASVAVGGVVLFGLFGLGSLLHWWRVVPMLSNSMSPGMRVGAAAVVTPVSSRDVGRGDVIVFQAPRPPHQLTIHRVVEVVSGGAHPVVRTRGDANNAPDPDLVRLDGTTSWRTRVVVPYLGKIVTTPWLTAAVIAVGAGILALGVFDLGGEQHTGSRPLRQVAVLPHAEGQP